METLFNLNKLEVMFIDLNSCFATAEQQAWSLYRGKPLVVAAYATSFGCVLSPSKEAKKLGIKTGMRVKEARQLCPRLIVKETDPEKYRDIHKKFMKIFKSYTPHVRDQSIDEAVLYFSPVSNIEKRGLIDIALEIKERIKREIGEWITCSIGISTNRFLAKTASSLHKPDGLDVITHKNIQQVMQQLKLTDLCGINVRNELRLNTNGIHTCLEFLDASQETLQKKVFKSIVGYYWFLRLHGFEIDDIDFKKRSFGQSYALSKKTNDLQELKRILIKLCEKMGRRLRKSENFAFGIHVSCLYEDHTYWHTGKSGTTPLYTTFDLFNSALKILTSQSHTKRVNILAVSCFNLKPNNSWQLELFTQGISKKMRVSNAIDLVNDRFGEYFLKPALMMNMENMIVDRISFGK